MRLRFLPAILTGILLGLFTMFPTPAQTQTTATITGTLTDPSGAAIAGAKIAGESLDSQGHPFETQTLRDGTFKLPLEPGRYRVTVAHPSFARVEQDFTLAAGEARTWDVRLKLETMSANVVVTAAAEPGFVEDAVVPVDVITREQIDQQQQIWLTPMLAAAPGAGFSRLGPMGGVTSFFLDGGNSNYTKVLVDGVPVNQPGGAVDLSNFNLDNVDKIEIVHGASSALYGSDSMDGVIQIFTHRGTTPVPQLALEDDGGAFGTGRGSGQVSGLLGAFDYSAGVGYFTTEGQGPGDFYRDATLSGNFGWRFTDTDSVRLSLRNSLSDAGQPGQTLLADRSPFALNPGGHSDLHDFSAGLNWNFVTGEHWQHQVSGFESRFQDLNFSPEFSSLPFVDKDNRAGFEEQSTYLFHNGGITGGYEYEVEVGQTETRHNQAGYLEARRQFGPRLTAIAGARVEANGFFGTRVVPRVGVSYALRHGGGFWGATRLRSSYGQGIKEPEILPPDCSPQLASEESKTIDAGVDQFFASDRIRLSVTYFHNDFRNIVSFAFGGPVKDQNCKAFDGSFFNTDLARAYGANSSFEVQATRWLSIVGNYSYDDSRVLKSPNATDPALVLGNRLFKRPLHAANLTFNAHFRQINWNFSGHYVGRRTDSDFLGLDPPITSDPSYVRWDMAMVVPIRYGLSATAHFENLFNNHYQDAVGYPALGYNYRIGIKYVIGGGR
jgi:vitamin B12 transporter